MVEGPPILGGHLRGGAGIQPAKRRRGPALRLDAERGPEAAIRARFDRLADHPRVLHQPATGNAGGGPRSRTQRHFGFRMVTDGRLMHVIRRSKFIVVGVALAMSASASTV